MSQFKKMARKSIFLISNILIGVLGRSIPLSSFEQQPLSSDRAVPGFNCDLPSILEPSGDGLPSAQSLFAKDQARTELVKRHQDFIRVPSVCWDDMGPIGVDQRWNPFYNLSAVLADSYPQLHKRAKLEKINSFGLLFTLEGSDRSLKPTLLTGHQDVVPVADPSTWTHPPFEGHFDGEWIWGRGSSDDKGSVTAILSAVEGLMSQPGWEPRRTLILAFGFDEECAGNRGAGPIGKVITERYGDDSIAIVLDEGGFGSQTFGDNVLYALPAVSEKGHVNLEFELHVQGGHSSIPFPHTGIGIMSEIVVALEAHPYSPKIIEDSPVHRHLICQGRYSPEAQPDITELLRKGRLDILATEYAKKSLLSRFTIQTSQAVDLVSGGQKINAMPELITVDVNYRVAPHDDPNEVQYRAIQVINEVVDKYNLDVKVYSGYQEYRDFLNAIRRNELSSRYEVDYNGTLIIKSLGKANVTPEAPSSGPIWDIFSGTIQYTFTTEGKTVVPVGDIQTGGTDTRHYLNLSRNVYRWSPTFNRDQENLHTIDERVGVDDYIKMIEFYYNFIRNFDTQDF